MHDDTKFRATRLGGRPPAKQRENHWSGAGLRQAGEPPTVKSIILFEKKKKRI